MRKSFFVLPLLAVLNLHVTAQTTPKPIGRIYAQGAAGISSHSGDGGELGVQLIINKKWSASFSYQQNSMKPSNTPSDYTPETGFAFILPYTTKLNFDYNYESLSFGKYFPAGKNSWLTLETGISFVQGKKVKFTHQPVTTTNFLLGYVKTSNYSTVSEKASATGAIVKADYDFSVNSFMGIGFGLYGQFNGLQSCIGFNTRLMLGIMQHTRRIKNNRKNKL